jgi:hypothetical protein
VKFKVAKNLLNFRFLNGAAFRIPTEDPEQPLICKELIAPVQDNKQGVSVTINRRKR